MQEKDSVILSIDLGGTKILTALVDEHGSILARDYVETPATEGQNATIQAMVEASQRVMRRMNTASSALRAVGIGAAGLVDSRTGILYTAPHLPGWNNVPLERIMSERLDKKTYIVNDANAAALGELRYGAAKGSRDCIYVTVSTGIGGGIIINGELYTGAAGTAGELGHMVIDDDGPLCHCGNKGCWEMLASGTALSGEAQRLVKEGRVTTMSSLAGGLTGGITAQIVHQAAQAGDELAKSLINKNAYYLGVGLANLVNLFSPELVVIGGGLSNIGDMLLRPAYEEASRRAFKQPYGTTRFVRAALGSDSGILGAAAFAMGKIGRTKATHGG